MGTISEAAGQTCQRWDERSLSSTYSFIDGDASGAQNYCRNPDRVQNGPWCFLEQPNSRNFYYCNIPTCGKNLNEHVHVLTN